MINQPRTPRRPGRPAQTEEEVRLVRERILTATSAVFAEFGYHGANVTRVIRSAEISRPTFYRYFRNIDGALQIVLVRIGRSISTRIGDAVNSVTGDLPRLVAGIDAYLDWGRQNRLLLRSLHAGAHDPASPVFGLRPVLLRQLTDLVNQEVTESGHRPALDEWTVDLFLNAMEYACYRLYQNSDRPEPATAEARATMLRTALALLGRADDWRTVLTSSEVTDALFLGR